MPMIYYGSRISDNLSTSPEGFLICHNVPIARTGYQDYLGSELPPGIQEEYNLDPQKVYKIYRSADEVFSPATIASFEGKPFTDNHPTEMVTTQNVSMYSKGHIQNVRKGEGEFQNMLIADVICTDESVTNEIKEKRKREVSCGYEYVVKKGPKGFEQTQIRGNHLALVENGRAGQKAAIQDEMPDAIIKQKTKGETNTMSTPKKVTRNFLTALGLKHYMQDAEPEALEQAIGEMGSDEGLDPSQGGDSTEKDIAELKAGLAQVMATLQQLVKSDQQVHEEVSDEDKLNALEAGCGDADPEDTPTEEKQLIEPEKEEGADADPTKEESPVAMDTAMKEVIKAMRPKLLAIPDEKARAQAVDAFVSAVKDARSTKPKSNNDYVALTKALAANAKAKAADSASAKRKSTQEVLSEQVSTINKYNPHLKKEDK